MSRKGHENWLVSAEHIGGGAPQTPEGLDSAEWKGFDVLTHTPSDRRWTDELHKRGIRSMVYMNLAYQWADGKQGDWSPLEYPETVKIDRWGQRQVLVNYFRHDGKTVYEICPSVRKVRDLCLREAEKRLKGGADGLFLDNAWMSRRCWGEQYGFHKHEYSGDPSARAVGHRPFTYCKAARDFRLEIAVDDEEQIYAEATLIKEIRDLARSINPEALLMANAGDSSGFPPMVWESIDSGMNEIFVYSTYYHFNLPLEPGHDNKPDDLFDWLSALEWTEQFTKAGKRVACLSGFSQFDPLAPEHALFAFCTAKLYDALFYTSSENATNWLRQFRLGQPIAEAPGSYGAVMFREFEDGLVAINPYGVAQEAWLPWQGKEEKGMRWGAVYGHTDKPGGPQGEVPLEDGAIRIKLMPGACALLTVPR